HARSPRRRARWRRNTGSRVNGRARTSQMETGPGPDWEVKRPVGPYRQASPPPARHCLSGRRFGAKREHAGRRNPHWEVEARPRGDAMSPDTIFAQAIEIAAADRAAFLDAACGDAAALRREVEQLVRDHFRAGAFLEPPAAHVAATIDDAVWDRPG